MVAAKNEPINLNLKLFEYISADGAKKRRIIAINRYDITKITPRFLPSINITEIGKRYDQRGPEKSTPEENRRIKNKTPRTHTIV